MEDENLLEKKRREYKAYLPMFCPAVNERVIFNADGFGHLRFHLDGSARKPKEQIYKLSLLPLVRSAIRLAHVVGHEKRFAPVNRKKRHGHRVLREVDYWGLEAKVGKRKTIVRVILRKIGDGKLHFWSVMRVRKKH